MMPRLSLYALCAALCASLALGGVAWWQSGRLKDLSAERDRLAAQVAALALRAELEAQGRAAALAEAERARARARDFDAVRDLIREGETDAPIPADLCAALAGLGLRCAPGGSTAGAPGGR
jgi:outer membrane murein-binding lipoprotein Lpp